MKEIFKTIPNFTDYEISSFGRLRAKERLIRFVHSKTKNEHFRKSKCRLLKEHENRMTGYKFYQLYCNKKMHNITTHRLVACTFLSNPKGFNCVNHIDGNKHNNSVLNLEWCTNEYNHEHATSTGLKAKGSQIATSKLNENCVHAIRYFINKGLTHEELSTAFKISRPTITLISQGKIWRHVALTNEELQWQK